MRTRRLIPVALGSAATGAALAGGVAVAAFTVAGSVVAHGTVATPSSPTALAHIATLWPGSCADVSVTFANHNAHPVLLDDITGRITAGPGAWRAAQDALAGRRIPSHGSVRLTIPDAVCLAATATNDTAGRSVAAAVTFGFHLPAETEYDG